MTESTNVGRDEERPEADATLALLNRLEQAEQAVARVREVCESDGYEVSNEFGTWDAVAVENVIDALDGDTRG